MQNKLSVSAQLAPIPLFLALFLLLVLTGTNTSAFLALNQVSTLIPAIVWAHLTVAADAAVGFAIMTLVVRRDPELVYWGIFGGIVVAIVVHVGKDFFAVSRPPGVLSADAFRNIGPALKNGSFPSGHTATAFYLAGLIASLKPTRGFMLWCLSVAMLLGFSRIAVGVHWPEDVMVGAAIGWGLGWGTAWIAHNRPTINRNKLLFTLVICLIGSIHLVWVETYFEGVKPSQWIVGMYCCGWGVLLLYRTYLGKDLNTGAMLKVKKKS